ncbi:hypothetical protein CHK_2075 [Christensenella hongkongensis]|uniref:Uncharacterized protein n=1 Tax=Christensenella hongkongensis TaxID=270498 RepID=A0A0M2NE90_9FIRM|nr:hypothetical protein CHK_2075 [Christensenella hongkongensis]
MNRRLEKSDMKAGYEELNFVRLRERRYRVRQGAGNVRKNIV